MKDSSSSRRALFRAAREGFDARADERARVDGALGRRLGVAAGSLAGATTVASIARAATGAGAGVGVGVSGGVGAGAGAGASVSAGGAWAAFAVPAKWIGAALIVGAIGGGSVSVVLSRRAAPSSANVTAVDVPARTAPSIATPLAGTPPAVTAPAATAAPPESTASVASAPAELRLATHRPAALAPAPSSAPSAPVTSVAAETSLLRRADEALREGDAARAMTLLDDHARAYPNGVLSEERSAERVSALCKVGRVDEAKREAARFLRTTPDSPLAGAVRSSCGGPSTGR